MLFERNIDDILINNKFSIVLSYFNLQKAHEIMLSPIKRREVRISQ
jgi:hypothetical protein